jgi:hypothetical protein
LATVKQRLAVPADASWTEGNYQLANRLAHLMYLRDQGIEAWLLCVYFLGDYFNGERRHFPATEHEWKPLIRRAKDALELPDHNPLADRTRDLFLPADPDAR